MPRRRRQPTRTCIGCREATDKKELLRVVRTPEGSVEIDPGGKRAGRGAYVCPRRECLDLAFSCQRLETALRHSMPPDVRERLREDMSRCLKGI